MAVSGNEIDTVVVIPARGGSQGVPRKNLARVGGIPLVARAVKAAARAREVDLVVVSTDDDEIAETATAAGAEIVHRPPELATATASSESAVLHVLDVLRHRGHKPAVVVLVQCTSPFILPEDIDGCVELLRSTAAGCAFTVARSHRFVWRRQGDRMTGVNHDPSAPRRRRQDLDPEVVETGAVYAMQVELLRSTGHRFGGGASGYEVPEHRAMEIDSVDDLSLARSRWAVQPEDDVIDDFEVDLLVLDFDGVLTDNGVLVDEGGREAVRADRGDGMGLELLRANGIDTVVLSKETNPVVAARCKKLGVEFEQSVTDKEAALRALVERRGARLSNTIFVGNDVNDVDCLRVAGLGVVPADAHAAAKRDADLILTRNGGHGAVRELADAILRKEGRSASAR